MPDMVDIDWIMDEDATIEVKKFSDGEYKVYEVGGNLRSVKITFGPPDANGYRRMLFNNYDIEREDFMGFIGMLDSVDESPNKHVRFKPNYTVEEL